MSEPRIVSPEEARAWLTDLLRVGECLPIYVHATSLAQTVATEPDRIRAAVVKALEEAGVEGALWARLRASNLENGAPLCTD